MTFDTYKERREHEAREKARERHIRKRMKKAGMNPDSQRQIALRGRFVRSTAQQ